MSGLDPEGDWLGRGARALENLCTATGEHSLEKLHTLLSDLELKGVNSGQRGGSSDLEIGDDDVELTTEKDSAFRPATRFVVRSGLFFYQSPGPYLTPCSVNRSLVDLIGSRTRERPAQGGMHGSLTLHGTDATKI
ncbi:hypothetical protein RND71_030101 [Anisodus tanguticus]|uniref:DUF8018 domain-containing protein n=1 Tax=Anisodus tanguticus TaxID=243964 RepID=A0AAE1RFR6_9SOLA|nr:hypothetical protein RND71_030101 [Anisodus tanguticus]